ncbi:MAG TPA: terminase family protein [Bryobacteraceae bacterium]|nr:terminase family protein [Bryobacteraceae bacterium]
MSPFRFFRSSKLPCARGDSHCRHSFLSSLYKLRHHACFRRNSQIVVAAPGERQAAELVAKAKRFAQELRLGVKGDPVNRVACVFPNGSRLVAIPWREDKIRGFSAVSMLVLDEASRVADELYEAVRPMLATTDGALWLISTPYGKTGFFYKEWAFGGEEWMRVAVRAPECSRISKRFLETERQRLSEATFAQEYLCEFVQGEDALFAEADIRASFREDVPTLEVPGWG